MVVHSQLLNHNLTLDPCRYTPGHLIPNKWESCFTIQHSSWGYDRTEGIEDFWNTSKLLWQLVSSVSCNGNLLLNVGPTADGRIVPAFQERLLEMGAWLEVCVCVHAWCPVSADIRVPKLLLPISFKWEKNVWSHTTCHRLAVRVTCNAEWHHTVIIIIVAICSAAVLQCTESNVKRVFTLPNCRSGNFRHSKFFASCLGGEN